jgi:hypothetical protein
VGGTPLASLERLIFADRPIDAATIDAVIALR